MASVIPVFEDPNVLSRLRFVLPVLAGDLSIAQAARQNHLSRTQVKLWTVRYKELGAEGLRNHPRGRTPPTLTSVEEMVLRLKRERRGRSARKIRDLLKEEASYLTNCVDYSQTPRDLLL